MTFPKRHELASIEEMEKRMKNSDTICNVVRQIYHMTDNSEIKLKCRLVFSMGKAMCERLMYYHETYGVNLEDEPLQKT